MHRYSHGLSLATLCLHLFFNSASCTVNICSPLTCRSDSPRVPPSDEPSGSGSAMPRYLLDVEELKDKITVTLRISGSWHYTVAGPSGYMLDVFEEGNEETRIGKFANPPRRSTAEACGASRNTIMFKSCGNHTVLDLPSKYNWTGTVDVNRPICFRATIQNSEDQNCQTVVECRSLNLSSVLNSSSDRTEEYPTLEVTNVTPSPEKVNKCLEEHNCTNTNSKKLCCSNGNTYYSFASRCHRRQFRCIYKKIKLECEEGICNDMPTNNREPFCKDLRKYYWEKLQWNVMCDCYGQFKPIQCHEDICWCSDEMGEQIGDSVKFEGSDTFNLSCF